MGTDLSESRPGVANKVGDADGNYQPGEQAVPANAETLTTLEVTARPCPGQLGIDHKTDHHTLNKMAAFAYKLELNGTPFRDFLELVGSDIYGITKPEELNTLDSEDLTRIMSSLPKGKQRLFADLLQDLKVCSPRGRFFLV